MDPVMPTHTSDSQPVPEVRLTFSTSVRPETKARAFPYASSHPPGPPLPHGDGKPLTGTSVPATVADGEMLPRKQKSRSKISTLKVILESDVRDLLL
jgi:hypothetical protein